jgi:type II secretory pathway pseudopilin PulG
MLMRSKDERGMAMITVILAAAVITLISAAVFQLSVGSLSHSAYDRKRDQAIQAAQGAVNAYMSRLPLTTKICDAVGVTYTLSTSPLVRYSYSGVWWSKDNTNYTPCPGSSTPPTSPSPANPTKWELNRLKSLVVTGTGTAGSGAQVVTRRWQTLVKVTPITGGNVTAFYGQYGLCIQNGPVVLHNLAGNDALIYSGGDIDTNALCGGISSGNMVVEGSIYAQGSIANLAGCIEGDVWAGGSVDLQTKSVGACVQSSYPSGYTITANGPPSPICNTDSQPLCYFVDSSGNPYGNTTAAGGSLTLSSSDNYGICKSSGLELWSPSNSRCSRTRDASGFRPAVCAGTVGDGSEGCGTSNAAGLTAPPIMEAPTFTYDAADWSPVYTVVPEDSGNCPAIATDIQNKISTGVSGNYNLVFYIDPGCALDLSGPATLSLKGNTIIVTKGSVNVKSMTIQTASGYCNTSAIDNNGNAMYPNAMCQFDVFVPSDVVPNPTSSCVPPSANPGTWDIKFQSTTDMQTVDSINFTPCHLFIGQQSRINGQGIAGVLWEANNFKMYFHPLKVPGFTPTGFNAAPVYFRECVPGARYC